jgi:hypothetical protein
MSTRLPFPRFNPRVLGSLLVVALPLLLIAVLVVLGAARSQMRQAEGRRLSRLAEQTAAAVDSYIYRRIIDVSLLAKIPTLREAATEAALPFDAGLVKQIERAWASRQTNPSLLATLVNSRCSQFLADIVRDDPIHREIIVTDRHGRLVGASGLTSDYDRTRPGGSRGTATCERASPDRRCGVGRKRSSARDRHRGAHPIHGRRRRRGRAEGRDRQPRDVRDAGRDPADRVGRCLARAR